MVLCKGFLNQICLQDVKGEVWVVDSLVEINLGNKGIFC